MHLAFLNQGMYIFILTIKLKIETAIQTIFLDITIQSTVILVLWIFNIPICKQPTTHVEL